MDNQGVSMGMIIAMQTGLSLLACGIWLLDHSRQAKQFRQLKRQQETSQVALRKFMDECEKTFLEFSKVIAQQREKGAVMAPIVEQIGNEAVPVAILRGGLMHDAGTKRTGIIKKNQVMHLADQGMTANEIAGRLDVPRGEIDLILNLKNKAFGQGAPN